MSTTPDLTFRSLIERYNSDPAYKNFYNQILQRYKKLPPCERRPYYKEVMMGAHDWCIVRIFWTPEGKTRPHKHGGSNTRIHVLQGTLEQDLFAVWDEGCELLERCIYLEGEEFSEDPETVHRIGNASPFDWAVSLHLFEPPLEKMEVFDFTYNERWTVKGGEDTMGDPPKDALPIWSSLARLDPA
ncbi:MAG: hypothetical protein HYS15_01710 [Candidatus Spechtbacteria bacterium]|nr:hypothetical protein [Candidatus Spechtbacteria bacterium]